MGLFNTEGFGKFINIVDGKLTIRAEEGEEGAVSRVNKENRTVWEKRFNSFVAKLVGIKTRDGNYGKEWIFEFQDDGDVYSLQLQYSNGLAQAFLKMLPNIDVSKEMKIQTQMKIVDEKKQQSIFVSQDGKTIKHAFTRENPNGMPDLKQVTVNGQLQWDSTDRMEWLHAMVERDIIPRLPEKKEPVANAGVQSAGGLSVDDTVAGGEDDDF